MIRILMLLLALSCVGLAQTAYKLEGKVTYTGTANIETWSGVNTAISASDIRWNQNTSTLSGRVCMETGGFNSGQNIRDGNGRDILEVSKFPQACLELSKLDWADNRKDATLEGSLDFRGQKKPFKIVGQLTAVGNGFNFVGIYKTSFSEWGMSPPRFLILVGYDPLEVKLEAKVTPK